MRPIFSLSFEDIITGSDSYHFFRLLSPLKRIFDSLCYVVVDDTSLGNYNMIATEENGEPCVLTLEQLARHGFTSEGKEGFLEYLKVGIFPLFYGDS